MRFAALLILRAITPSSRGMELPTIPGRFTLARRFQLILLASTLLTAPDAYAGTITDTGEVTVLNGVLNIGQTTDGVRIVDDTIDGIYDGTILGAGAGSSGELRLQNSAEFTTLGSLVVGRDGNGLVHVSGGSQLDSQAIQMGIRTGDWPGCCSPVTTTSIVVEGQGSTWTNSGLLEMGDDRRLSGYRTIRLSDGARLLTGGADLWLPHVFVAGVFSSVTIEGAGTSWSNSGSLLVSGMIDYVVRDGARAEDHGVFVSADYSRSRLVVDGAGSLWSTGDFRLGLQSNRDGEIEGGGLFVTNGGVVQSSSAYLSTQTTETVHIDGVGSEWSIENALTFGGNAAGGSSRIEVTNGATLRTGETRMVLGTGFGSVLVDGPNSHWENTGPLTFGDGDETLGGLVDIRDGASVSSGETSVSCSGYGRDCEIRVSGPGSTFRGAGGLFVGGDPVGALLAGVVSVDGGGSAAVDGAIQVWQPGSIRLDHSALSASSLNLAGGSLEGQGVVDSDVHNGGRVSPGVGGNPLAVDGDYEQVNGGTLSIVLAAGGTSSMLDVLGTSVLGGDLEVELAAGFVPQLGDRFEVMRYSWHAGEFETYIGLDLGDGITLIPEYGSTSLVLRAVPEPGTALLVGVGLAVIGVTRSRKRD